MKKFYLSVFFFLFLSLTPGLSTADEPNLITAVSDVAQKTGPAVVSIKTERIQRYQSQGYIGSPSDEESLNQFFQDFFGVQPDYEQKLQGLGSGVIIDARGYILTNDHVVHGADKITVSLPDGRKFDAALVGIDTRSDLAVIKIDSPKTSEVISPQLPVANLGNSESLKIGQWVVAIGNPFGHILDDPQPTVTSGVISALHRALPRTSRNDLDYSDLIQTDAAINPGNSGGPLVNLYGDVVGINTAIFSTSGGYQGIGFAIPINYAKAIVEQLIQGKKVAYGWIGVGIQDIDDRLAQYFNLGESDGAMVTKVLGGGPAEKAGIKEGDIILSVNGLKVRNTSSLLKQVSNAVIGKPATLGINRDQKNLNIDVTIGQRPDGETTAIKPSPAPQSKAQVMTKPWRGISAKEITSELAKKLHLANTNGMMITSIEPNSPADLAGLQKGDVIIAINKQAIRNLQDYTNAVQSSTGSSLIRTVRGFFVLEANE